MRQVQAPRHEYMRLNGGAGYFPKRKRNDASNTQWRDKRRKRNLRQLANVTLSEMRVESDKRRLEPNGARRCTHFERRKCCSLKIRKIMYIKCRTFPRNPCFNEDSRRIQTRYVEKCVPALLTRSPPGLRASRQTR